ncbi:endolytic transglycosylase MltG [Spiribacter sp. C176]|uniref:Endolytic murein transglycosylase n=1 Tax=Spiribacter salilacus TaxID=2664894 RepID=A0A6N7QSK8_9GAMM|nr:endolytic transglycosylase MltG [Spiribacter salilacus]MRH77297.1 endolytic transglycosylase MltG [Spiribacter salilacus]
MKQKILFIGIVLAGVLLGAMSAAWLAYERIESQPVLSEEQAPIILDIPAGTGVAGILNAMAGAGLDVQPQLLRVYLRLRGADQRLQAGEYAVQPGDTAAELVARMVSGAVIQHRLTIVEGWRFDDLMAALHAHPAITPELAPNTGPKTIMTALNRPELDAEGRFLPETYLFTRGTSELAILKRALAALEAELAAAWENRAPGIPLSTPDEALILASIIEKETALPEERREIAGVFTRRLQQGMRLQTDPTVIYGLGDSYTGRLRRKDLTSDTPWNTYTRHGLPPTPIALAGAASIRAAVNPAEGDTLYFVSRGDGSHVFSVTYEQHNAAVRRYILGEDDE